MTVTGNASTAAEGPPPELVERFRASLDGLAPEGARLGLAVSGGPDSTALLLLAQAAIPGRFEVASVDHGLRPEAAEECALVVAACEARGISCEVLRVAVTEGNVQARARRARYVALGAWAQRRGLEAIATAHHADDQAETLLMRLNRGSGIAGLSGVRERVEIEGVAVPVIRPLLGFRRAQLAGLVAAAGVEVALDPSNADPRFDRVRMRNALARADWLDPLALALSARHLAEANEVLEEAAEAYLKENLQEEGDMLRLAPPGKRAIALIVLGKVFAKLGSTPRGSELAVLLDRLEAGQGGNLAGVLATVEGNQWCVRPEPPRRCV